MPLTAMQKSVLQLLAKQRDPESHVAGGIAINLRGVAVRGIIPPTSISSTISLTVSLQTQNRMRPLWSRMVMPSIGCFDNRICIARWYAAITRN